MAAQMSLKNINNNFTIFPFITLYTTAHFAVDAACAFLLLGGMSIRDAVLAMLIYNALAFVFQAPIGWVIDKTLNPKLAASIGLVFVALSYLFPQSFFWALFFAGIGNALFHVGGGSLVLSVKTHLGTYAGIFVAPGAIGLTVGSLLSKTLITFPMWIFPATLLALTPLIFITKAPEFIRFKTKHVNVSITSLVVLFLLIAVAVRSLIGMTASFPWKENQNLLFIFVAAIALGKVFGGYLSDKFGLMKVGVSSLLVSAPLMSMYSTLPFLGILGVFLFNFAMPVTLIALSQALPGYKGLAFGLTTVALFVGSLPTILGIDSNFRNEGTAFALILITSLLLYIALKVMHKRQSIEQNNPL